MTLLRKCIHVRDEYELGRKEVSLPSFKYVTHNIDRGQEIKKYTIGDFPSMSM